MNIFGLTLMAPIATTLHILLALAAGEAAPPEISRQVAEDSQGTIIIGERTFYYALKRLIRDGYIEQTADNQRYTLTQQSRRILKSEQIRAGRVNRLLHERV